MKIRATLGIGFKNADCLMHGQKDGVPHAGFVPVHHSVAKTGYNISLSGITLPLDGPHVLECHALCNLSVPRFS